MAGTNEYNIGIRTGEEYLSDLYVKRQAGQRRGASCIQPFCRDIYTRDLQIAFVNDYGEWAQRGVPTEFHESPRVYRTALENGPPSPPPI